MLASSFTATPWLTLSLAAVLYLLDMALTLRERYLYFSGAREVVAFAEVYPLERPFDYNRGMFQLFNRRYVIFIAGMLIGVPLAWWVLVQRYDLPWAFLFASGGLLLFELTEIIRLLRYIALFQAAAKNEGVSGQLEVTRYLFSNLYAIDMYGYALIYLLAFLFSSSLFFLGGAVVCVTRGHGNRDFAIYQKWLKKKRGY